MRQEERITLVSLVPTMLARLLDAGLRRPPALRWALLGGGPIAPALLERARAAEVPVAPTLRHDRGVLADRHPRLAAARGRGRARPDDEILVRGAIVVAGGARRRRLAAHRRPRGVRRPRAAGDHRAQGRHDRDRRGERGPRGGRGDAARASGGGRCRGPRAARPGMGGSGHRHRRRSPTGPHRSGGAAGVHRGTDCRLQGAEGHRLHRRAPAHRVRQVAPTRAGAI